MIKTTRTVEGVKVGEALPLLQKTFTTADLVAYGAATWDWHRLHYDADYDRIAAITGQPTEWVAPKGTL